MKRLKYKVLSVKDLEQAINKLFKSYEEIQLAYLYGSYAINNQTEFSDIDIGVVLKRDFKKPHLYFAELSSKIEEYFNFKINVDLSILNNATPRFLYNVIKNGVPLYIKDEIFRYNFEIKTMYDYLDIKPMLDKYDKLFIMEELKNKN